MTLQLFTELRFLFSNIFFQCNYFNTSVYIQSVKTLTLVLKIKLGEHIHNIYKSDRSYIERIIFASVNNRISSLQETARCHSCLL